MKTEVAVKQYGNKRPRSEKCPSREDRRGLKALTFSGPGQQAQWSFYFPEGML